MVFDRKMKKNNTSNRENEEKGTLRDRNAVKIFTIKIFSRKKQSCLYFTFYFCREINLTGPKSETESMKPTINGYNFLSGKIYVEIIRTRLFAIFNRTAVKSREKTNIESILLQLFNK
jgi:hypothetical protein